MNPSLTPPSSLRSGRVHPRAPDKDIRGGEDYRGGDVSSDGDGVVNSKGSSSYQHDT